MDTDGDGNDALAEVIPLWFFRYQNRFFPSEPKPIEECLTAIDQTITLVDTLRLSDDPKVQAIMEGKTVSPQPSHN